MLVCISVIDICLTVTGFDPLWADRFVVTPVFLSSLTGMCFFSGFSLQIILWWPLQHPLSHLRVHLTPKLTPVSLIKLVIVFIYLGVILGSLPVPLIRMSVTSLLTHSCLCLQNRFCCCLLALQYPTQSQTQGVAEGRYL